MKIATSELRSRYQGVISTVRYLQVYTVLALKFTKNPLSEGNNISTCIKLTRKYFLRFRISLEPSFIDHCKLLLTVIQIFDLD